MLASVYIETSIVSYLVARPSRDAIMAVRQRRTREWWANRRGGYRLVTSETTVSEALLGEPAMASKREAALNGIPLLATRPAVVALGKALITRGPLPSNANADAYHIAFAAVHGIGYLLTWNCTHIANPSMHPTVRRISREHGFELPVLCTPEELLRR
jgi:predicted nucleic acid-binding protein